jgi:cytochrome c oxidase cbb3-type subunit 3
MNYPFNTRDMNVYLQALPIRQHVRRVLTFGFLFLITGAQAFAQDSAAKSFMDDPINHPMMPLYLVATFLFVTLVLVVIVAIYMLRILNAFVEQAEKERAQKLGIPYVPGVSWWTKMWDELNAAVPISKEKDIDLGHEYDGIRELDNHLPPWWKGILYGSVIWAVIYMIVYHFSGSLPLSGAEYESELAEAAEEIRVYHASQPVAVIDENTLTYTNDAALLTNGKKVFLSNNCQSCHRDDGGGNAIGPNLADTFWIHGGSIKNIFTTIKGGVVEKGMPAWGKVMSPSDVRDVAFYVMSLQGTNPPNAKAAQGNPYTPAEVPADSTKGVSNP